MTKEPDEIKERLRGVCEALRRRGKECREMANRRPGGPVSIRRASKAVAYEHAAELVEAELEAMGL